MTDEAFFRALAEEITGEALREKSGKRYQKEKNR